MEETPAYCTMPKKQKKKAVQAAPILDDECVAEFGHLTVQEFLQEKAELQGAKIKAHVEDLIQTFRQERDQGRTRLSSLE